MIKNINKENWNEWFAGLTDGDGSFYINKKEASISFELTTSVTDIRILEYLKHELKGGSIKLRSNANAVRYRVKKKEIIQDIVNRLNGKLYNPGRVKQFKEVCVLLNIPFIQQTPTLLSNNAAYLAGLFDSDGTISISISKSTQEDSQVLGIIGRTKRLTNSKSYNQIFARVTSIYPEAIQLLCDSYGFGSIYVERPAKKNKNWKTKYHWTIRSQKDFFAFYTLIKKTPLRSVKMHRLRLSVLYFKYKKLKYHLKPTGAIEYKIWAKFCKSWFKYSF